MKIHKINTYTISENMILNNEIKIRNNCQKLETTRVQSNQLETTATDRVQSQKCNQNVFFKAINLNNPQNHNIIINTNENGKKISSNLRSTCKNRSVQNRQLLSLWHVEYIHHIQKHPEK